MRSLLRNFRRGLKISFHAFSPAWRPVYRCVVRPFASPDERDFFRPERVRAMHDWNTE